MTFQETPQRLALFDWVRQGTGSLMLQAVAGSGKTTAMVGGETKDGERIPGIVDCIPDSQDVVVVAFNKEIAEIFKKRTEHRTNVRGGTCHSVGFAAYRRFRPGVRVDEKKVDKLIDQMVIPEEKARSYRSYIKKMVALAKAHGLGTKLMDDTPENWFLLRDHYDIYLDQESAAFTEREAMNWTIRILQASQQQVGVIDFDDMLYMPLFYDASFYKNDWVIVDEAQDTNAVQLEMIKRMLRKGGRVVAVGDERQSIYSFRGADSEAMKKIKETFGASELPLSVTWRCGKKIVEVAKPMCPQLEAAPDAKDGVVSVETIPEDVTKLFPRMEPDDAVLCRTTAPLVSLAYQMIGAGKGCRILGKEIGKGLIALIDRMKARTLDTLTERLAAYEQREAAKWTAADEESRAQAVIDRVRCIQIAMERLPEDQRTVDALKTSLDALFSDNGKSGDKRRILTLSTVHKAKGKEYGRVWVWRADLMPLKWARKPHQIREESNVRYVAFTRAKDELILLNGAG